VYRGHDEVRHYVEDWLATMEDLRIELFDPAEIGDHVVAAVRASGRGSASGLEIDTSFCQVWTVRDGAAVAMEEHPGREQGEAAARAHT
jgi:ketosteroid isomerase-like protein